MYLNETLAAGAAGAKEINEAGDFLRILSSAAEDVALKFYYQGREVADVQNVGAGYSESLKFDRVRITTVAGGQVSIVTRMGGQVSYDRAVGAVNITGTVTVKNENGGFSQTLGNVTGASGQLLAANANRRYLLIQNNDAGVTIYLRLDGTAATVANGVKLTPGQSLEIQGRAPTGQINVIGSGATTAVAVLEG